MTITDQFRDFHSRNPQVYQMFKEVSNRLISRSVPHLSSKFIWEIVRYEVYMHVDRREWDKYKLNNNFTAYYGRMFVEEFPEFKKKFEFRTIKSSVCENQSI